MSITVRRPMPRLGPALLLGPGAANAACRDSGSPVLLPRVEASIDRVIARKPYLFDVTDVSAPNTTLYKVLDAEGYLDGNGAYCTGPSSGCQVTPGNPFQLWAYVGGRFAAETDAGVSCTVDVER